MDAGTTSPSGVTRSRQAAPWRAMGGAAAWCAEEPRVYRAVWRGCIQHTPYLKTVCGSLCAGTSGGVLNPSLRCGKVVMLVFGPCVEVRQAQGATDLGPQRAAARCHAPTCASQRWHSSLPRTREEAGVGSAVAPRRAP